MIKAYERLITNKEQEYKKQVIETLRNTYRFLSGGKISYRGKIP